MGRKRETVFMGIGILAGLALSGPAVHATTTVTAALSNQPIYVDGQRVSMTAYNIGGNNYVRLRDIGQAVNFDVTYDAITNSVLIYSAQPYQEQVSLSVPVPAAPVPSEEMVQDVLRTLREQYPNNTAWPSPYRSTSNSPYGMASSNCAGWATLCSDAAFGNLPWRRVNNPSWEQIRPGDLIEYSNDLGGHVIVVIKIDPEWVTFTDSGTTQKAYWGGQYPRWWLEQRFGLILYTRYPE